MTKLLPCIEWADMLALKPSDLSPERRAALEAHLATCPGCAATYADYQRLITRLRALPRPALPPLVPLTPDFFDDLGAQNHDDHTYDNLDALVPPPAPENARLPTRPMRLWRKGWPQRLSAIAAVLLLTVLVGSMALLFQRSIGPFGSSAGEFHLRPGWAQLAEFSGTGSQTIKAQGVTLPRMYGTAYGCSGSGHVRIKMTSLRGNHILDSYAECNGTLPIASPQTFSFDNIAAGRLDTITITADAQTRWFFQFTQAIEQPTLTLSTQWTQESGSSSQGNSGVDDETVSFKTWGIVFICFGSGSASLTFLATGEKITFPACDGQPHLNVARFNVPSKFNVSVTAPADMLWSITSFGCTNEERCAQD